MRHMQATAGILLAVTLAPLARPQTYSGAILLVSSQSDMTAIGGASWFADLTRDGRYAVFATSTPFLPPDKLWIADIFRKDLNTGAVVAVSTTAQGLFGNKSSVKAAISDSGLLVAFETKATNLTVGGFTTYNRIVLKDLATGNLRHVTSTLGGLHANADVQLNGISGDGRYVIFSSSANNLVSNDRNGFSDAFRKDMISGVIERVSVRPDGVHGNGDSFAVALSRDGRFVLFNSLATSLSSSDANAKLSDVYLRDMVTGQLIRVSESADGSQSGGDSWGSGLSSDGRYATFSNLSDDLDSGDGNSASDVFRKSLATGHLVRVSTNRTGQLASGSSAGGDISDDGRYVLFSSTAKNLVVDSNGREDLFRKDCTTNQVIRVNVSASGVQAVFGSGGGLISADGRVALFDSGSNNLVNPDLNGEQDVFAKNIGSEYLHLPVSVTRIVGSTPIGSILDLIKLDNNRYRVHSVGVLPKVQLALLLKLPPAARPTAVSFMLQGLSTAPSNVTCSVYDRTTGKYVSLGAQKYGAGELNRFYNSADRCARFLDPGSGYMRLRVDATAAIPFSFDVDFVRLSMTGVQ